ncbi:hypothetical protein [Streptomyces sp. AC627_RSS907]|uniref:hypothetical protein n=1 Tax=Streptomyces sp. AC627_RSS907 TaxID=2823684 RepID=UPI0020B82EF1|nr:hypothetical protein [Streptomyces sp. AC627_RSS907]
MPRSGGPRTVTGEQVAAVVPRTPESTPENVTHGSTRAMAKETGLSQSTVSWIWRPLGLQPHHRHRAEVFKKFLARLDQAIPRGLDVHLVLDDYATHKTPPSRPGWWPTPASTCTSRPPDRAGRTWSSGGSPS